MPSDSLPHDDTRRPTVALIGLATTRGTTHTCASETFLWTHLMASFERTVTDAEKARFDFKVYVGVEFNPEKHEGNNPVYSSETERRKIVERYPCVRFVPTDSVTTPGHLTAMWNIVAREAAFEGGADYLYQCGDDVVFNTPGWVSASVDAIVGSKHPRLTLSGPVDAAHNTGNLMTQCMVPAIHVTKVFNGNFFPPVIKNWYCDNWITTIYQCAGAFAPVMTHTISNWKTALPTTGDANRYEIDSSLNKLFWNSLLSDSLEVLVSHLK